MIPTGTPPSGTAPAPLAETLPATLAAADVARIERALHDSRAPNTRAQYRSAWKGWAEWAGLNGHVALPADPAAVAAYLAERIEQGAAASTVRATRAAIGAAHRDAGADDPTAHDGVRQVLAGLGRQAAGRGQAQGLTADDVAEMLAAAPIPRRTGRGMESEAAAGERGVVDRAIVALLFHCGLRRSEAAAVTWGDVADGADGQVLVTVRRSKTDQTGETADVRAAVNGCARAIRQLRDRRIVQRRGLRPDAGELVLGGLNGQSIARRLTAAARAAGINGRITGHSGRIGLAQELTRRGAPEQAVARAGGWKSSRMVTHYSAAVLAEQGAVATYLR